MNLDIGLLEGKEKRKNLILAPSNKNSLVKEWMSHPEDRTFDVILTYYDDDEQEKELEGYFDELYTMQGFKYPCAYSIINNGGITSYEYIWMPDDDILLNTHEINRMFELMKEYDLWLAMPSIVRGKGSFNTFGTQAHHPGNILRHVGFVEVQCPVFSSYALKKCWSTFNESQSGWGIDLVWPKLLGRPLNKIAILDDIKAKHTRPVGKGELYKRLNIDPDAEMHAMKRKYDVKRDPNIYGVIKK